MRVSASTVRPERRGAKTQKNMETTIEKIVVILAIMEKKMETTIVDWGYIGANGKESGNYCSILGSKTLLGLRPYCPAC